MILHLCNLHDYTVIRELLSDWTRPSVEPLSTNLPSSSTFGRLYVAAHNRYEYSSPLATKKLFQGLKSTETRDRDCERKRTDSKRT